MEGFWSYVHADNSAEGGRIVQLGRDLCAEFEMISGDSIDLFIDRDTMDWGDDWVDRINQSVASAGFFVPVLTPRYFTSAECRRELRLFVQRAEELGVSELILPLHYVNVQGLTTPDTTDDDLIRLMSRFNWIDWRELRFEDVDSKEYRSAVSKMANRLASENKAAEIRLSAASLDESAEEPEGEQGVESGDQALGLVDRIAAAEEALPKTTETLVEMTQAMGDIGEVVQAANDEVDEKSNFSKRLSVLKVLSQRLVEPVDVVAKCAYDYAGQLNDVDRGIRTIIGLASSEVEANPDSKDSVCAFFQAVLGLSASARQGIDATETMIADIGPLEQLTRVLRPPLRRLRKGLTVMVEARDVSDGWVGLIEATGIDCS